MSGADKVHTVKELVALASKWLGEHDSSNPRLDAEVLLAHLLRRNRLGLWLVHDMPVDESVLSAYRALLKRRQQGEPVAYILGRREFYGRDFAVSPACLIPRPETEHVVDAALERLRQRASEGRRLRCLDLGTGSGCIAITLALECPGAEVVALDSSAAALEVSRANAQSLNANVDFHHGDMFAFLNGSGPWDLVVSNPPYITLNEAASLQRDVREHEPHAALFSGADALAFHERLLREALPQLVAGGALVLELPALDAEGLRRLHALAGAHPMRTLPDLAGIQRVLVCG